MKRATLTLVLGALLVAVPSLVPAQVGGRMRVLVPPFQPEEGAHERFGRDVAERLARIVDGMPRHVSVERDAVRDALRRLRVQERELDCIRARQLATHIQAELVLCGSYRSANGGWLVSAHLVSPATGSSFDLEPFQTSEPGDAASRIAGGFERFTSQLQFTAFCHEYLGSEQPARALENCDRALEYDPVSVPALYGRGTALLQLDSLGEALGTLERLAEIDPVHKDGLYAAGLAATRLGRAVAARDYFRRYMELDPENVDVRLKVASDMGAEGDPAGGLALLRQGLAAAADNPTYLAYAGHLALAAAQKADSAESRGLFEEALGLYREVFRLQGTEADAGMLRNMMVALLQLGRIEDAASLGIEAVAAKPDDAALWSTYAEVLERSDRLDEALEALDRVLVLRAEYPGPVHARAGLWALRRGRLEEAVRRFRDAAARGEVESTDDVARNIAITGYNEKAKVGQYEQSRAWFAASRQLARRPETTAMANFFEGWALYELGRKVGAPETLASARQALPVFQEALRLLETAGAYREQAATRGQLLEAAQQYLDIQNAIIKRGR